MTNETLLPKTPQQIQCSLLSSAYGDVRTFIIEEKPWFAGKDVVSVLGYKSINAVIKRNVSAADQRIVCRSELPYSLPAGMKVSGKGIIAINETALTDLAIRSRKRNARDFRRWLLENVPIIKDAEITPSENTGVAALTNFGDYSSPDASGVQIFHSSMFGELRGMIIDSEPWFVGKDVATALGYAKERNAIATHVLEEDKKDAPIQGPLGGTQKMTIVNESGLYSLIFGSKLEKARAFKHWVTSEVLPSIRKTGEYSLLKGSQKNELVIASRLETINNTLQDNIRVQSETIQEQQKTISKQTLTLSEYKRKSEEKDRRIHELENQHRTNSYPQYKIEGAITLEEFANLLKPSFPDISRNKLFEWMRQKGYLYPDNHPVKEYIQSGYLWGIPKMYETGPYTIPLITEAGKRFFTSVWNKEHSK